ncbi:MAG: PKD domain-containing protein [Sediminibacterium sp.]
MKKICLLSFSVFLFCNLALAVHIKGGLIKYEYVGPGTTPGTSVYTITVSLYRSCQSLGPNPSDLKIYDPVTYAVVFSVANTASSYTLEAAPTKTTFDPCISSIPNPPICYQIYSYKNTVTLTDNVNGYLIVVSDARRITNIKNIPNSNNTGITFTATIPGIIDGVDYHINSSPTFDFKDTALICYNSKFKYQFSASDKDGDQLTYVFGNGLDGTATPSIPPYSSIPYTAGYSGGFPLGSTVTIDSLTGLISGIAPAQNGEYVIAVYVHEWRNGVIFNSTKKELQITVADCSLSVASLKPSYINCDNFVFNFQNETTAPTITSYAWDFGVTNSITDVSTNPTPTYTYADTGTYTVKLTVRNAGGCTDSASSLVKVYPGFTTSFTASGSCHQSPFDFTDMSFIKYGTGNWSWNFGDTSAINDTSNLQNPSYKYSASGDVIVEMKLISSKGCTGEYSKVVAVNDKPFINLAFTDTLICSIDSLPLKVQSNGSYQWTPNYKISNTTILNPIVYPKDTTVYTLTVTDKGCIDSAKIKVNVLKFITVKLGLDSGICKTDSILLRPVSDALSYKWRESLYANSLSSYLIKFPSAAPLVTTTYYVTANLGYCQDSAKIKINVAPYPKTNAGNDTAICFGSRILLNGNITANTLLWTPTGSLLNSNTVTPVAGPVKTTSYILTVKDTSYCPKTVSDTVVVKVIQPINLDAGKDTSVTIGQTLQLFAKGADTSFGYQWTPSVFLSNANVYDPIATVTSSNIDSILYSVKMTTPEGCSSYDDVLIHVYKNGAEIFVPTAFTPNGDGRNDVLRPILIGITQFDFFKVYNRRGQLIFSTTQRNKGWDGTYNGTAQEVGTYVYMTQGKGFAGGTVYRKGTSVLIR